MLTSQAHFKTPNGSKYLGQLCKHFAHKVEVEFDDTHGHAALPPGPAQMHADADGLMFTISAQDDKGLQTARFIIEDHLKRFAFRENFTALDWN